jgi:hypothetical protein
MLDSMKQMQSDLSSSQTKITDLQRSMENERTAFKRDQQSLESRLVEMTTSASNYDTDKADRDGEINVQVERAKVSGLLLKIRLC